MNLWFISGSVESKAKGILFKRSLLLPLKLDGDFLNNISKYMESKNDMNKCPRTSNNLQKYYSYEKLNVE